MQLKNIAAGGKPAAAEVDDIRMSTDTTSVQENPTNVNPNAARVEVLDFRTVTERHVRAACRVRVGAILIDNVRIVQPTLGQPFVAMPQRKQGDAWLSVVTVLSPSLEAAISNAVMAAWREVRR